MLFLGHRQTHTQYSLPSLSLKSLIYTCKWINSQTMRYRVFAMETHFGSVVIVTTVLFTVVYT